jgi:hypothetical protein
MKSSSKHLDSDRKETKAGGEKKDGKGTLMDGIVRGLAKNVSPPVVDGIIRGIPKNLRPSLVSDIHKVEASATPHSRGMFGSGAFPEGKMGK